METWDRHFLDPRWWSTTARPPAPGQGLRRLQLRRLRALLHHAWNHSPYYRELWSRHGVAPWDLHALADLPKLPTPDPELFRSSLEQVLPAGLDRARLPSIRTSGTSGQVMELPCTSWELSFERFLVACELSRRGLRATRTLLRVKAEHDIPHTGLGPRRPLFPVRYLPAHLPPAEKVREIERRPPGAIWAWRTLLLELATELERRDHRLRIPVVFNGGSALHEHERARLEHRLADCLLDVYASWETSILATQGHPRDGLRVRSDLTLVELLDEHGQPAAEGSVHCTVLWRRTVPLIRYPLGDRARWRVPPDPEGGDEPVLQAVKGRIAEPILLPSGGCISHGTFVCACIRIPGIERFQLVQEAQFAWALRLVPRRDYHRSEVLEHLRRLEAQHPGLTLRLDEASPPLAEPGKKYREVVML